MVIKPLKKSIKENNFGGLRRTFNAHPLLVAVNVILASQTLINFL